jgi:hypothetical protein
MVVMLQLCSCKSVRETVQVLLERASAAKKTLCRGGNMAIEATCRRRGCQIAEHDHPLTRGKLAPGPRNIYNFTCTCPRSILALLRSLANECACGLTDRTLV